MQPKIDAKSARKLARNLERYLKSKGIALTRVQATDALARMLETTDYNALARIENSSAQESEFATMVYAVRKRLRKSFLLYVTASSKSDEACEPRWARIALSSQLWTTVTRWAALVQRERLLRTVDFGNPDIWSCESPNAEEDHTVQLSKLLVEDDQFWYSGYIGNIEVETKPIGLATLAEAITGPKKKKGLNYLRSGQIILCEDDHLQGDLYSMLIEDKEFPDKRSFRAIPGMSRARCLPVC